ncbi:MAG: hypothetical protein CM15mV99_360 [Caudoviricetes sp.]|nr:MAG: hypothetical protein CM15mV99_360 [Caudoviricetes sp.]
MAGFLGEKQKKPRFERLPVGTQGTLKEEGGVWRIGEFLSDPRGRQEKQGGLETEYEPEVWFSDEPKSPENQRKNYLLK